MNRLLQPLISFDAIELWAANLLLEKWGHKMGPLKRGNQSAVCHALYHETEPVAVTMVSTLIAPVVGGGLSDLTRDNCVELSRLCAVRSGLCRVALRLWREFVFPALGYQFAISYQDADLHNGATYRFDGWKRAAFAHSGKDTRSQRPGRNKWVWVWPGTYGAESGAGRFNLGHGLETRSTFLPALTGGTPVPRRDSEKGKVLEE